MRVIGSPETSVSNSRTSRNNPEDGRIYFKRGGIQRSRNKRYLSSVRLFELPQNCTLVVQVCLNDTKIPFLLCEADSSINSKVLVQSCFYITTAFQGFLTLLYPFGL